MPRVSYPRTATVKCAVARRVDDQRGIRGNGLRRLLEAEIAASPLAIDRHWFGASGRRRRLPVAFLLGQPHGRSLVAVPARGVDPPFDDVARDHERSRDYAIRSDLRVRTDIDQRCARDRGS
jgi:hypothetical protein